MNFADIVGGIGGVASEYRLTSPEGWGQGRALHGGVAAALSLRAAREALPNLPPLRSMQAIFLEPAVGDLRIVPELLRKGRSSSIVGVDCYNQNKMANRLMLTFGGDRESDVAYDRIPLPNVPGPDACPPFEWQDMPEFFSNFDMRQAGGSALFSHSGDDELLVWVRFREDRGGDGENALMAVADVLPPAAVVSCRKRAPISTMSWSIDINQPANHTEWYLLRSTSEQAGRGYSRQNMACWSRDGGCLAVSRQTVAIFF